MILSILYKFIYKQNMFNCEMLNYCEKFALHHGKYLDNQYYFKKCQYLISFILE